MKRWALLVFFVVLGGCVGKPANVEPVANFQLDRYLGRWYEVARLDHSFERGLSKVSAEYSLRDDGGVRVINRGYDAEKGEWKEAEGKAYFVQTPDTGYLKVSFFGPFYGSYVVFALDQENYQYTMISGPDTDYLWILARQPVLDDGIKTTLIEKAKSLGFATDQLIFVKHD
jgi:apolipoprotein D and lipocalin family protein